MKKPRKLVSPLLTEDEPPRVATFKTSLREWQARWQARHAAQAIASGKEPNQAVPV